MKRVTDGYVLDGYYFETPDKAEDYRIKRALKVWIKNNSSYDGGHIPDIKLEIFVNSLMKEFNVGLKHESFEDACNKIVKELRS